MSTTAPGRTSDIVASLLSEMTLAEKAGQIAQVEKNSIGPEEAALLGIGSILSGGGGNPAENNPANWKAMVQSFVEASESSRLGIPILYGTDAVHGHSNVVGATIFPHNIGLGAAGSSELVEAIARATAAETAATGARWTFAPAVSVSLDHRWGRCYESFSDDPELAGRLGEAAVRGLQAGSPSDGARVAACVKHFVGDGGTTWGSVKPAPWLNWWDGWGSGWKLDQGDTEIDEEELRRTHLAPYLPCLAAGALTVMASYNSWNGDKLHGHRYLLTEVLKNELGFEGFVISDWMGIGQLDADPYQCVVKSMNAGMDMVMIPIDYEPFLTNVIKAVEAGDISMERLDDAVARILRVKEALGLFGEAQPTLPDLSVVGGDEHRGLARRAAASCAVLLKNDGGVLPVGGEALAVAGVAADDIGLACGGWTIEWAGGRGATTPGSTLLDGLRAHGDARGFSVDYSATGAFDDRLDQAIVVVAEEPYVEGQGDNEDPRLSSDDLDLVARVREVATHLTVVVFSGRPIELGEVSEVADAVVAAWLPGSEAAGVADVLVGSAPFEARLPRPWPGEQRSWDRGAGLSG